MSYRTVKRLLGETSLERKCRFLFASGLLLLIAGSFYLYALLNADLLNRQNETTARMLIRSMILKKHWQSTEPSGSKPAIDKPVIDQLLTDSLPEEGPAFNYQWVPANLPSDDPKNLPEDTDGYNALARLKQGELKVVDIQHQAGKYHYYAPILAAKSCLKCHPHKNSGVQEGALMGMVKLTLPRDKQALNKNYAFLITTAIVTSLLAMLAAFAIVRYVIVKPVLHLKDISDEIARGNLDLRADIRTGDEFEELSHAFNRMLRHLVTVQDELREVNTDLDGKVDELAQVNLRLYEMNKLKDEFLATMSHELRTPLNSILGFSDVLAGSDKLSEKQKRFVSNIQTSGKDLMLLINDVLDLAKIESGKMELQIIEFPLIDLVDRQVSSLMPLAARKNIEVTSEIDTRISMLFQDPGKLQQILNNLLSNAIKFTPEGGRVRIRAGLKDDSTLELVVEDTGIGIPLEEQATIFEKFRQGQTVPGQKDAMTREYGGTGLGLSIVKELSKLLGGEVTLDSEFGKGSTFLIRLPMRLDAHPKRLDEEFHEQRAEFERPHATQPEPTQSETQAEAAQSTHDETAA